MGERISVPPNRINNLAAYVQSLVSEARTVGKGGFPFVASYVIEELPKSFKHIDGYEIIRKFNKMVGCVRESGSKLGLENSFGKIDDPRDHKGEIKFPTDVPNMCETCTFAQLGCLMLAEARRLALQKD